MTHSSSQPTPSISQHYPTNGPPGLGYDLHQGGYGESQMFPHQQFQRQGPSSPCTPRVPPGPPGNNQPISSSSTLPPGPPLGAPGRPPISLRIKRLLPPAKP
jgi:hypothetical protein